jgi:hypothetical protein
MSELADAIAKTLGDLLGLPVVGLAGRVALIAMAVLWLATAWWAWRDMESRTGDVLLRSVATAGIVLSTPLLFPFAVVIYLLLRPPRPDEPTRALELRLTELQVGADPDRCPRCRGKVRQGWQRCPACGQVLSRACPSCGEPVGLDWQLCAWCAAELPWTGEPVARKDRPPVAIPIVPGGRPLVPVMAVPDEEHPPAEAVAAVKPRRRPDKARRRDQGPRPDEGPRPDQAHPRPRR